MNLLPSAQVPTENGARLATHPVAIEERDALQNIGTGRERIFIRLCRRKMEPKIHTGWTAIAVIVWLLTYIKITVERFGQSQCQRWFKRLVSRPHVLFNEFARRSGFQAFGIGTECGFISSVASLQCVLSVRRTTGQRGYDHGPNDDAGRQRAYETRSQNVKSRQCRNSQTHSACDAIRRSRHSQVPDVTCDYWQLTQSGDYAQSPR